MRPSANVPLLLAVISLREQPTHQFDEHRHSIVGELLAQIHAPDQRVATAGMIRHYSLSPGRFAGKPATAP
ncbi:hypothetical protein LB562_08220 [Mesorhizobium sp. B263B1A]|nr:MULTISPECIES: hypothetical protein [unclassified Mesorhizobium]MCA0008651.1 hypothetical protein [Mesorhizobium sp. B264B1B]MCA0024488.1 hypothetical protein [Mesorhizobium sp. B263B1A]